MTHPTTPPLKARRRFTGWKADLIFGALLTGTILLLVLFANLLFPAGGDVMDLNARLQPPTFSGTHPLGTDPIGRDVLARVVYGGRISLIVGLVSVALSALLGSLIGLIAGYYRASLGSILMRLADIQLAFPFILLAITVIAIIGPGLWKLIAVMVLSQWAQYARLVRGVVLSLREREYVQAAHALGANNARMMFRHIVPNAIGPIVVLATLNVANNILLESGLTFLGLGVDPQVPSWGGMLADGRTYLQSAWWVSVFPGVAITLTVLGFNLLGDWLRDHLDPHGRR
ncbi:ABC transporter permease [Deinococcus peraridilitoris]|uniref:ABC-type dipeptide/oligopeptide/nickel transport system, permease component n=1 Tax=Deinococcus peraridilitoris (strain DSM 19664 / LMG 22246 / CIP 109416 / KR-200) TaxID=937777 RepID=L0A854_DEIPD|nr:ABC transporter permease [Deinococcus peraridilitoris]AFZ69367.1 ABC-type dipeptide/oligopeptide/nickel transport system, permease component [Deinococcus peraridilitoris DSM 19664]